MAPMASLLLSAAVAADLALTPPMGWMSWEIFRCNIDCEKYPDACINEQLYRGQTDALVAGGFASAGYNSIHIDDCWMNKTGRGVDGKLSADTSRFPSGMKALGDYMHAKNVKFGLYTAESPTTCAGYPASKDNEVLDAATFASWGVDYMKVDGCGDASYYPKGYPAMGNALQKCGRDIVYSCSWPAYLGSNESTKPFDAMIASHCNLWRNYDDIQCNWGSLANIIAHWGQYGEVIAKYAAPGHWNDPDMLLIGNDCITVDEAQTQMAIWSIVAAPLIMGNDLRNVSAAMRDILLNKEVIAVNQDSLGVQGVRTSVAADGGEVWMRKLATGHAFALYNPTAAALKITVDLSATPGTVRNLWTKKEEKVSGVFSATIPTHGTSIYTVV